MDEQNILNLLNSKDEAAITELSSLYGAKCMSIAFRILKNKEDA